MADGRPFTGFDKEMVEWLRKLYGGNLPAMTSRVLIDIPIDGLATIYTQQYCDKAILAEPIPQALMSAKFIEGKGD